VCFRLICLADRIVSFCSLQAASGLRGFLKGAEQLLSGSPIGCEWKGSWMDSSGWIDFHGFRPPTLIPFAEAIEQAERLVRCHHSAC